MAEKQQLGGRTLSVTPPWWRQRGKNEKCDLLASFSSAFPEDWGKWEEASDNVLFCHCVLSHPAQWRRARCARVIHTLSEVVHFFTFNWGAYQRHGHYVFKSCGATLHIWVIPVFVTMSLLVPKRWFPSTVNKKINRGTHKSRRLMHNPYWIQPKTASFTAP